MRRASAGGKALVKNWLWWRVGVAFGLVVATVVWVAPPASAAAVFSGPTNFPAGNGPVSVAAGDLDGDGDLDLAVANLNSNNVTILLNDGSGSIRLMPPSTSSLPGSRCCWTLMKRRCGCWSGSPV